VEIPKADGGMRPLGIPTVADRIAQEVARRCLEPHLEPVFHADSYGYRPGRSAIDAVRTARQRCWRHDWVLDIDVKGYFDSIDWKLLLKAVRHHTDCPWVLLYIERWLKAPVQMEDGSIVPRTAGTPQGGVISLKDFAVSCPLLVEADSSIGVSRSADLSHSRSPFKQKPGPASVEPGSLCPPRPRSRAAGCRSCDDTCRLAALSHETASVQRCNTGGKDPEGPAELSAKHSRVEGNIDAHPSAPPLGERVAASMLLVGNRDR
jgi:hypothetical protein